MRHAIGGLVRLSMVGFERGPHVTRYFMYEHLPSVLKDRPRAGKVLSISHSTRLCKVLGLGDLQITEANYPASNILSLPFPDNEFDYVVSDQVLEHVEGNPQQAVDECFRVLKAGGVATHTTCLIQPIHPSPMDLWRFTPDGLRYLCRTASTIIDSGAWGNLYVLLYTSLGLRNDGVPKAKWHPVHSLATICAPSWPIVTWIAARK